VDFGTLNRLWKTFNQGERGGEGGAPHLEPLKADPADLVMHEDPASSNPIGAFKSTSSALKSENVGLAFGAGAAQNEPELPASPLPLARNNDYQACSIFHSSCDPPATTAFLPAGQINRVREH
jgi:hypothetical protein